MTHLLAIFRKIFIEKTRNCNLDNDSVSDLQRLIEERIFVSKVHFPFEFAIASCSRSNLL